ncbi:MAG: leucine-rich repeat protein [Prevotella sp.]|nr:leucine-rich repeat protein [Prevotella sp.]
MKSNKHYIRSLLTLLLLMCATITFAHDFAVSNSNGKTIYYGKNSDGISVYVTYRGRYRDSYSNEYSGEIVIPETVTYGGKTYSVTSFGAAFDGCSGLTSVTIPASVTSIGSYAFSDCSGLTSVTIPNSVTSIGYKAFYNTRIKSLTIGSGIQTIDSWAFDYSSSGGGAKPVKVIWLSNTPPSGYKNAGGTINYVPNNSYSGLSGQKIYPFLSSMFEVDGIKYVPVSPSERTCDAIDCVYNESAENTKISNTVTYKNINMTVQSVGDFICTGNFYIKNLEYLFDSPIGSSAFSGCSGLTSVTIGSSVTSIGSDAFNNCSSLKKVIVPNFDIKKWCSIKFGNHYANPLYYARHLYSDENTEITELIIPDDMTSIPNYVFSGCSGLTSVTIPNSVTSIGSSAFSGCSGLTSVTIPNSVTSIGSYAFSDCSSLTSVRFENSKDNTPVTLGSNSVFSGCPLDEMYIGRKLSYTTTSSAGYSPFYKKTTLRSVKFTDKETEISDYEFYGCTNLTEVSMGDGVKSIGTYAFSGCSSLEHFTCGRQLESIGKEAFSDCTSMTKFRTRAAVPPTCGAQALDDINKWECTLYVPTESIDDYQAADQWKNFFFIEKFNLQGDSNGDDVVNAKDYSGVASYIMGETPEAFDAEASDVDENGTVDVRDNVGIANIITTGSIYGGTSNNAKAAMSKGMAMPATDESDADNVIYVENVSGSKNSQVELSVRMRNASDIRGFQFDLYLPEGVTIANNAKASLSSDRLAAGDAHTLMADEMTDGAVRFLCSSMKDESFAVGDGEIATLTVNIADNVANGDYDVVVKNAIMTETDISRSYEADDIKSTLTVLDQTGVETVTADNERRDGSIYTVGGQLVGKKSTTSQLRKGIYIRNGRKFVVK